MTTQTPHPTSGAELAEEHELAFFRVGNYRPVADELTEYDLPVSGSLPAQLCGWYLRNGPNPRQETGHWFVGEGMLHGVRLEGGSASWYRNRWVRTESFSGGGSLYGPHGTRNLAVASANTHVVNHAGRTLALVETSLPYEVDLELNTIGRYDFDGRLTDSMTAHPKVCPRTGELHFFGSGNPHEPFVTYHRANADGQLVLEQPITVPGLTMMHDFHLTATHVVFMDLPVVFDTGLAGRGDGPPYRWDESYGARLGVMRRDDPATPIRWFEIDRCYVFHGVNAHDDGDRIVLHVLRYPFLWRGEDKSTASLWRWTIDVRAGRVEQTQLDDRPCEFPRIDDRLVGSRARHGHVTQGPASTAGRKSIIRYDLETLGSESHVFGAGRTPGEAVFVAADDEPGADGWLLTYVYDARTDTSTLEVLDTTDLASGPVATVHLPTRVPFGFHGNWIPDSAEHSR